MTDAVIVSTARTAIGTAFKGSLVDVDAFELGTHVVAEAVRRSGRRPRARRRRRPGRVALRRRRHRPLRRHRGRARARRRRGAQPPLRRRPGRGHDRRRHRSAPAWTAWSSPAASHSLVDLAAVDPPHPRAPTTGPTGCRRPTATGPTRRTWTCRSRSAGTPRSRPASPARRWTPGRCARTSAPSPASTPAASSTRSSRSRSPAATASTATFAVDEHPRRGTSMEKLAVAQAAAPRDRGLQHHRRQRLRAPTTARPPWWSPTATLAEANGLEPLAVVRAWASVGRAARADRAWRRRSPSRRRSTAPASTVDDVDLWEINEAFASMCVGDDPGARHRRGASSTSSAAAAAWATRSP